MLKNERPVRHLSLSPTVRGLTVAAMAAVGLAIAGLRGPAGDAIVLAQDRPAAAAGAPAHDLSLLPAEARMVISVRPAMLLRRGDFLPLLNSLKRGPLLRDELPVPPEEVEQAILFWQAGSPDDEVAGPEPYLPQPSGFVLRVSKPQDWKAWIAKNMPHLETARHEGRTYYRSPVGGPSPWAAFWPDDRTIVGAWESALRDLISDSQSPPTRHPWDEAWRQVAPGQVMMGVDTRWVRRRLTPLAPRQAEASPGLELFSPLYKKRNRTR